MDTLYASAFVANFHFAQVGSDYFRQNDAVSTLQHWWSLAVEEQFYLVWPLAVLFTPGPLLLPLICVGIAIAAPFRAGLTAAGHPLAFVGILTPSVLDCLGLGSLLGLVSASPESEWRRLRPPWAWPSVAFLPC